MRFWKTHENMNLQGEVLKNIPEAYILKCLKSLIFDKWKMEKKFFIYLIFNLFVWRIYRND